MGNKMAIQNQDWLKEFEPIEEPVADAGALVLPGIPKEPEPEKASSGYRYDGQGNLEFIPGGPSDPEVIAKEAAARRGGEGKTPTEIELEAKQAGAQKRSETINAILGTVKNLYKADIAGQPIKRLGGLLEYFSGLPKNERFNAASNAMLPLIRPLVAQSAKEGDSDKEMAVFMAYIPQASDSDTTIETKINMLETLIGGMVDGRPPSVAQNEAILKSGGPDKLQAAFDRGASEDELLQIAGELYLNPDPTQLRAAIEYRDAGGKGARIVTPPVVEAGKPPEVGLSPVGQALYAGLGDIAQGVGDIAGLVVNPVGQALYSSLGYDQQYDLGQIAREAIGAPIGDPTASAIIRGATGALAGAGGAGALAARLAPGLSRSSAATLASQPIQQAVGGAGAGLGAEIARQQGAGPLAQTGAALLGGVAGAGAAGAARTAMAPRLQAPRGLAEAESANIPVMTSDILPPETFAARSAQQLGERIPFAGTGPARAAQQEAREDAVSQLIRDFGAEDVVPKQIADDLRLKRQADLTKYMDMKKDALSAARGAGDVPVPKLIDAIDRQIAKLSARKTSAANEAVAKLRELRSKAIEPRNIDSIEAYRSDELGPAWKDAGLSVGSADLVKSAVKSLYDPLRQDMGDFIGSTAGQAVKNKWGVANARLSEGMDELRRNSLKSALRDAESTPEKINNLLFSAKPSDVAALYRNLTPTGRAAARAAILRKAAENSTVRSADGTLDLTRISPDRFANSVASLGKSVGIMFSGDDLTRVKGLVDALRLTQRASQASASPVTGAQIAIPASLEVALSYFGAPGVTTMAIGTTGVMARIFESKPVRDLMLKMGRVKEPEKAATAKRLIAAINAASETKTSAQETNQ
jgi:hypothetical protein